MTQPAKVQEPSMEEILASIRRIIADDEAKPPAEKPASPAASVAPAKAAKPAAAAPPAAKPSVMSNIPPSAIPAAVTAAAKVAAPPRPASPPAASPPAAPPPAAASNSQDDIDALLNGLDEATSPEEIRSPQPDGDVLELTDEMAVPAAPQPAFRKVEPQDDLEFTETAAARAIQRQPLFQPPPVFEGRAAPPAAAILSRTTV